LRSHPKPALTSNASDRIQRQRSHARRTMTFNASDHIERQGSRARPGIKSKASDGSPKTPKIHRLQSDRSLFKGTQEQGIRRQSYLLLWDEYYERGRPFSSRSVWERRWICVTFAVIYMFFREFISNFEEGVSWMGHCPCRFHCFPFLSSIPELQNLLSKVLASCQVRDTWLQCSFASHSAHMMWKKRETRSHLLKLAEFSQILWAYTKYWWTVIALINWILRNWKVWFVWLHSQT
jgi:hypothetical protein